MTINETFKGYVTSSPFNLSLSNAQVKAIWQISILGYSYDSHALRTCGALTEKGLVIRETHESDRSRLTLTKAGSLVLELLVEAGLVGEGAS